MANSDPSTRRTRRDLGRVGFIVAFLSPACILYAWFVLWPLFQTFQLSLFRWRGVSTNRKFVGGENYQRIFQDEVFLTALKNTLILLAGSMVALFALGILVAFALQQKGAMSKVLRSTILFPQVISLVVVAIIWYFLYNPSYGLLTKGIYLGWSQPLGVRSQALPAVWIAFLWWALGFYAMLFSAGLKNIPEEIGEAAELDGSSGGHRFWNITWPLLWSTKRIAATYIVANVMNIFALVTLMTNGGPDRATETLLTYLYEQGFKNGQFGYASALAAVNLVIALGLAGLTFFFFRKNPEGSR